VTQRDVLRLLDNATVISPLVTRCVADIEAQPVRWLWPGRIARGKVTMVAGHPGLGKSQVALDIAARVTAGGKWPVDGKQAGSGTAIILSGEDDAADTIRPRLEAAGADLTGCHIIEAAYDIGSEGKPRRRSFSLGKDIARLDAELSRIGNVRVIIIDPITAYLGKTDSHRNAEVRAVLAPLAELAARHGVAALAVSHLRKATDGDAVLQVTGSLAFVAAARGAYIVVRDADDPARRLLLPAKNNIGRDDLTGYAYRIETHWLPNDIETCRIAWEPELVTVTADEALAARGGADRGNPPKRNAAAQWLAAMLADGPVAVKILEEEAKEAGHSWATVRRAGDALEVTTERSGYGADGGWAWRLPDGDAAAPGTETEL
jgi:hypothetical protein